VPGIGFEPSGNWRVVESTVEGLRVRVAPGLDAYPVLLPSADTAHEYRLAAGERVLRLDEAGSYDGYDWWEILGTPPDDRDLTMHGYVASGPANDPWLSEVDDPGCPAAVTLDGLVAIVPFMRVACYDRYSLTFAAYAWTVPGDGYGGACGEGVDGVQVAWLQCDNINHNWVNATGNTDATLLLHYNPDVLPPPDVLAIQGQRLTITGHFLDPASATCAVGLSDVDQRVAAYWECAMKFVVDRLEEGQ